MTKDKRKPPERDADRVRGAAEPVESAPPEQQAKDDSHQLEDLYPEPSALLSSFSVPAVTSESVVVALDTSVLLVPYDMRASTSIDELKKAYEALAHGGRLFLPARSLREFVSRRDSAIGNAIDAMIKQKDRFPKG